MNGVRILVIATLFMLTFSMTAAADTTNVTIRENEYIVLENDIYIEVLDVGVGMRSYAEVWFYSYQDSVGKTETLHAGDTWPTSYTSGTGRTIDVTLDYVFSSAASFVIESSKELSITERHGAEEETEAVTIPQLKITRTLDMSSVELGQAVKITFTIKNDGNGTATEIELDESTITGTYKEGCPATIDDIAAGATQRLSYDLKIVDAEPGTYELNPTLLNYKSESGTSYSSESSSNVLVITVEEVLILMPELEITIMIESDDDVIICGDRFPATIRIDNTGNATTGRVTIKSHLLDDVRVADGDLEPVYESIKPGDYEEYEVMLIAYEPGKHVIEMDVMWADDDVEHAIVEFRAERSGFDKYYIYILAAIPIVLILLWLIKRRRDYSF